MIEFETIQDEIQDLNALLAQHERALASHPGEKSLRANINTLKRRRQILEDDFLEAAARVEADVCSYRLIPNERRPTILAVSKVLGGFQSLFSLVYDAIKEGPKKRATLSKEVLEETSLAFAYSFTGSVGFVMTLPNERLLFGETYLDQTMQLVFEMAKTTAPEQVAEFVKKLGAPPVRAIYKWAGDHVEYGLSADIEWRRKEQIRSSLFIQKPQLEQLREAIAKTSDETEEEMEVQGSLVGADVTRKSFHLETVGGGEIQGSFAHAISVEQTVELPKPYMAKIRKRTKIIYSMEDEQTSYFLLHLAPLA